MDLDIRLDTSSGESVVLHVRGSVDMQSRDDLIRAGQQALRDDKVSKLVLDLTNVTFMDSTGVGALVELSRDVEEAHSAFQIANPSVRVRRILDLTGLSDAWDVQPRSVTPQPRGADPHP